MKPSSATRNACTGQELRLAELLHPSPSSKTHNAYTDKELRSAELLHPPAAMHSMPSPSMTWEATALAE